MIINQNEPAEITISEKNGSWSAIAKMDNRPTIVGDGATRKEAIDAMFALIKQRPLNGLNV